MNRVTIRAYIYASITQMSEVEKCLRTSYGVVQILHIVDDTHPDGVAQGLCHAGGEPWAVNEERTLSELFREIANTPNNLLVDFDFRFNYPDRLQVKLNSGAEKNMYELESFSRLRPLSETEIQDFIQCISWHKR